MTDRPPLTMRADRVPPDEVMEGYLPLAPDLAVECIALTDLQYDIDEKLHRYLDAGTQQVWTVYPHNRSVVVWTPDYWGRILREQDTLVGGDALPGFHMLVAEIFKRR